MSYFAGIGAQKAATTWIHRMLDRHPQVEFPLGKEAHYWDRPDRIASSEARWVDDFSDAKGSKAIGEITPAYATLEPAIVETIAARCPSLRIFISLRNPIERAWSSALMALERAEMRIDEASDAWFIDHLRSQGSLARGDYARTIDTWRRAFGEQALCIVFYDDLCSDPSSVLRLLSSHLGISPLPFEALPAAVLSEPVFPGRGIPIRESLTGPLHELYADAIDALGRELGRDLNGWHTPSRKSGVALR